MRRKARIPISVCPGRLDVHGVGEAVAAAPAPHSKLLCIGTLIRLAIGLESCLASSSASCATAAQAAESTPVTVAGKPSRQIRFTSFSPYFSTMCMVLVLLQRLAAHASRELGLRDAATVVSILEEEPISLTSSFTFATHFVSFISRLEIGLTWTGVLLLHQFDLAWPPLLREKWFERAVKTQARDKTFAGHGLDPVAPSDAFRLFRREPDCRRAVGGCLSRW